jgi:DNA-binding CsgD family transcriptional regulator
VAKIYDEFGFVDSEVRIEDLSDDDLINFGYCTEIDEYSQDIALLSKKARLTRSGKRILQLILKGHSATEISKMLGQSLKSVCASFYRSMIKLKKVAEK